MKSLIILTLVLFTTVANAATVRCDNKEVLRQVYAILYTTYTGCNIPVRGLSVKHFVSDIMKGHYDKDSEIQWCSATWQQFTIVDLSNYEERAMDILNGFKTSPYKVINGNTAVFPLRKLQYSIAKTLDGKIVVTVY